MRLIDSEELVNYYLQNQADQARFRSETANVCDVLENVIRHVKLMDEIQPKETAKWEVHHRVARMESIGIGSNAQTAIIKLHVIRKCTARQDFVLVAEQKWRTKKNEVN